MMHHSATVSSNPKLAARGLCGEEYPRFKGASSGTRTFFLADRIAMNGDSWMVASSTAALPADGNHIVTEGTDTKL
jgi:hypothetical protein